MTMEGKIVPPGRSRLNVAVAGAGMTGAYLYRLLTNAGCRVHLFDREQNTQCGLTPCAWGTTSDFTRLVQKAGLDPAKYILKKLETVVIDGLKVNAELLTFDKPALIHDLLGGATYCCAPPPTTGYDRIIDATGAHRALLPPIEDDVILNCCQYLVETDAPLENRVRIVGVGYAWCFPLSDRRYHMGCGTLLEDPRAVLKRMGWFQSETERYKMQTLCGCLGTIRLTGPHQSLPFVVPGTPSIWGIGEAIGCVAPLVGDGIAPGMRSVELLLDNWEKPAGYQEAILSEFQWMKEERDVVDALKRGETVGIREARILLKNSRRMNLQVGIKEVWGILKILAANYVTRANPG
ncbi:hypothetical protein LPW11_18690 [Geomonas sp. RF6]|uniref:hypothetical protein n=1 Tax=Geomonas sp. RF6 TaxID=2897342 RepID=UPI001E3B82B9|nr:hypothetical protein [Geomonas sp. RF6]UFS69902.1 hypothetical protein LPW11_18690 [Geomonas sp. RF6]